MTSLSAFTAQLLDEDITARQSQLGVLRIQGNDAKKFLQGQATCDISKLSSSQSLYGAICNIKGRIITNFYLLQEEEGLLMLMDKLLVEKTLLHLKKYAVFFKTELLDASTEFHVCAQLSASNGTSQLNALSETLPTQITEGGTLLQVAESPINIQWLMQKSNHAPLTEEQSDKAEVLSLLAARPLIHLGQSEETLPQWLNMQRTGGISFTKGCYTGQEIVARMQYRGKSKKQLALFSWQGNLDSSKALLDETGKSIGQVFNVAHFHDTYVAQVILNIEPDDASNIILDGKKITLLPLPYLLEVAKS